MALVERVYKGTGNILGVRCTDSNNGDGYKTSTNHVTFCIHQVINSVSNRVNVSNAFEAPSGDSS